MSDVHRSDTRSGSSAWCCLLAETHGYEEQVDCYCLYQVLTAGKRVVNPIDYVKVRLRSQRCLGGGLGELASVAPFAGVLCPIITNISN